MLLLKIIAPTFVLADSYTLMSGEIPGLTSGTTVETNNLAEFIVSAYNYVFGLGVALAVLMIVIGGVQYTLGWTPALAGDAKGRIGNAIIGLVILFTSFLLLETINPALVKFDLNLKGNACNTPLTGPSGSATTPGGSYTAGGGGGTRDTDPQTGWRGANYIKKETLRTQLTEKLRNSKLNGFVPSDGAAYGIKTGSPEEWANYLTELAGKESSYNNKATGDIGRFGTGSNGLFQLSQNDAVNYKLNDSKPFTMEQLQNPDTNMSAAISIQESLVIKKNSIKEGAGRYWGPIQRGWLPYIPKSNSTQEEVPSNIEGINFTPEQSNF